jgi:hypothetical protein
MSHTKSHQDSDVCGLGEERQGSRDGEYNVSERINGWRTSECGGIMGDGHRVAVGSLL